MSTGTAALRASVIAIERAGVFSANETKDDIATGDLKYFLAPFYLSEVRARVAPQTPIPPTTTLPKRDIYPDIDSRTQAPARQRRRPRHWRFGHWRRKFPPTASALGVEALH